MDFVMLIYVGVCEYLFFIFYFFSCALKSIASLLMVNLELSMLNYIKAAVTSCSPTLICSTRPQMNQSNPITVLANREPKECSPDIVEDVNGTTT